MQRRITPRTGNVKRELVRVLGRPAPFAQERPDGGKVLVELLEPAQAPQHVLLAQHRPPHERVALRRAVGGVPRVLAQAPVRAQAGARERVERGGEDLRAAELLREADSGDGLGDEVAERAVVGEAAEGGVRGGQRELPDGGDLALEDVPFVQGGGPVGNDLLDEMVVQRLEAVLVREADDAARKDGGVGVVPLEGGGSADRAEGREGGESRTRTYDGLYMQLSIVARSSALSPYISTSGTPSYTASVSALASAIMLAKVSEWCRRKTLWMRKTQ